MGGGIVIAGRYLLAVAVLGGLLLVAGCGSSSSGDAPEVTVQAGSLSKAEFVKRADAICAASRSEFESQIESYFRAHKAWVGKADKEDELLMGLLDTVITPNFQREIKQISTIGAPKGYTPEAAAFLNSLETQLAEMHADISKLENSRLPFKASTDIAKKAGMQGCAESFG